jgi:hypothetical protein
MRRTDPVGTSVHGRASASEAGDRALDAMAKAARRARLARQRAATAVVGAEPDVDRRADTVPQREPTEGHAPSRVEQPAKGSAGPGAEPLILSPATALRSRRRWAPAKKLEDVLRACVLVTACLVVVLGAVAAGLALSGGRNASPTAQQTVGVPRSSHLSVKAPSDKVQPASGQPGGQSSNSTSPSTTVPPPSNPSASGPAPVLSAITPDAGAAGQIVTLNGSNLFSQDGNIQASFGGQPADITCPTETSCMMTVPLLAAPAGNVAITVTTTAGTSVAMPFTYALATASSCGLCQFGGPHRRPSGEHPPGSH